MASFPRHSGMRPVTVWQSPAGSGCAWLYSREPESCSLRLAPQSLFHPLVGDMQTHLDEMERMRLSLLEAYPLLCLEGEARRKPRPSGKSLAEKKPGSPDNENFQLSMDVSGFSPDELGVKMEGRKLTVSGKQEKKTESEDGCCCREYRELRREALLPEDVNLQAAACVLSQDGQLCIEAPRLALPAPEGRSIPISLCQGVEGGEGALTGNGEGSSRKVETGGEK